MTTSRHSRNDILKRARQKAKKFSKGGNLHMRRTEKKQEPFSAAGHHQANIDREEHTKEEFRFKALYGKWPTGIELMQAGDWINRKHEKESEE